jgi:ABC-type glycerol-3-phosphate transport system substrate-binding protein
MKMTTKTIATALLAASGLLAFSGVAQAQLENVENAAVVVTYFSGGVGADENDAYTVENAFSAAGAFGEETAAAAAQIAAYNDVDFVDDSVIVEFYALGADEDGYEVNIINEFDGEEDVFSFD